MQLGINGFTYDDLFEFHRLNDLALAFDRFVEEEDADLFRRFDAYRHAVQSGVENGGLPAPEESALLIGVGRHLSHFVGKLFRIESSMTALHKRARRDSEVAKFKREFVAKRVAKIAEPAPSPAAEKLVEMLAPELVGANPQHCRGEVNADDARGASPRPRACNR